MAATMVSSVPFSAKLTAFPLVITGGWFGISTTTSVNIIQESQDLCIGQSIVLDAEGGNGNYTWSPAVGLSATTGNQVTFTPPTPGVYTISLINSDSHITVKKMIVY